MRETVLSLVFVTQTASGPTAIAFGEVPTEICETTFPFPESMTPTELGATARFRSSRGRGEGEALPRRRRAPAAAAIAHGSRLLVAGLVSTRPSAERDAETSSPHVL